MISLKIFKTDVEDYINSNLKNQKSALNPSLDFLEIGTISIDDNNSSIPFYIPLTIGKALCFQTNSANLFAENLCLNILSQIDSQNFKFTLIDLENNQSFANVKSLDKLSYNYECIYDETGLENKLKYLYQQQDDISKYLLNAETKSLKKYIESDGGSDYLFEIIIITNFSGFNGHNNSTIISQFNKLIEHSSTFGQSFIFVNFSNKFDFIYSMNKIEYQILDNSITKIAPLEFGFSCDVLKINISKNKKAADDFLVFLKDYSNEILNSKKKEIEIIIPIGFNAKKKSETVNFQIGKNSTVFNTIVVGSIGTGKTNFLDTLIYNGIKKYSKQEINFCLLDFKMTETTFDAFSELPHIKYLSTNPSFSLLILKEIYNNFDTRKKTLEDKNRKLAPLVLIIDEGAEILKNPKIVETLEKLYEKGRELKIYIILSLVRTAGVNIPSRDQIAGGIFFRLGATYDYGSTPIMKDKLALNKDLQLFSEKYNTDVGIGAYFLGNNYNGIFKGDDFISDIQTGNSDEEFSRDDLRKIKIDGLFNSLSYSKHLSDNNEIKRIIFPERMVRDIKSNNQELYNWIQNDSFPQTFNKKIYIGGSLESLNQNVSIEINPYIHNNVFIAGSPNEYLMNMIGQMMFQIKKQESKCQIHLFNTLEDEKILPLKIYGNIFNSHQENDFLAFISSNSFSSLVYLFQERKENNDHNSKSVYIFILGSGFFKSNYFERERYEYKEQFLLFRTLLDEGANYGIHFFLLAKDSKFLSQFQTPIRSFFKYQIGFLGGNVSNILEDSYSIHPLNKFLTNEIGVVTSKELLDYKGEQVPDGGLLFSQYTNQHWNKS